MSADLESEKNKLVGTVTLLLRQEKSGSNDVSEQLFSIYFQRLVRIARNRLPVTRDRRVVDEEDLAVQVLASFFVDLQTGKDVPLKSRTDVPRMLARRFQQRAANQVRDAHREKRGRGKVSGESVFCDGQGQPDPNRKIKLIREKWQAEAPNAGSAIEEKQVLQFPVACDCREIIGSEAANSRKRRHTSSIGALHQLAAGHLVAGLENVNLSVI